MTKEMCLEIINSVIVSNSILDANNDKNIGICHRYKNMKQEHIQILFLFTKR